MRMRMRCLPPPAPRMRCLPPPILTLELTLTVIPPRLSFSCSLSVSSVPSPSHIAASSWSNNYNFLTVILTRIPTLAIVPHS